MVSAVTKTVWPKVDRRRSCELFAFNKISLSLVVVALTGHCLIGVHAVRLKILPDASCRGRLDEDKVETSQHFLIDCVAFARSRHKPMELTLSDIPSSWWKSKLNAWQIFLTTRRFADL